MLLDFRLVLGESAAPRAVSMKTFSGMQLTRLALLPLMLLDFRLVLGPAVGSVGLARSNLVTNFSRILVTICCDLPGFFDLAEADAEKSLSEILSSLTAAAPSLKV